MKAKRRKISLVILCIILVIVIVFWVNPNDRVKTAIKKDDLRGKNYILCKYRPGTGYTWDVVKNPEEKFGDSCVISGVDPRKELHLNDDFMTADNTFVFYVAEKNENSANRDGEKCVEYVVSGWDVLYPLKHGVFLIF